MNALSACGSADLHLHTTYGWDGTATVSAILRTAAERGLNVVAITDHDQIAGALVALELAPDYNVEVVPGIEVSTADGHLLALYVRHVIPPGRPLLDTLQLIRQAGGLAVAPHPAAAGIHSLSREAIYWAQREVGTARTLVGIETLNGSLLFGQRSRRVARLLTHELGLAQVGGSDAHSVAQVGASVTQFAGRSAADLHRALEMRLTRAVATHTMAAPTIVADWLLRYSLRCAANALKLPRYCPCRRRSPTRVWRLSPARRSGPGCFGPPGCSARHAAPGRCPCHTRECQPAR